MLMSELLNFHLGRFIERHREMNKIEEIAARVKGLVVKNDARLDALFERADKHESVSDAAFRKVEGVIEASEAGMKYLEDQFTDRSNDTEKKDDGGQTEGTVTKFLDTGEKAKAS